MNTKKHRLVIYHCFKKIWFVLYVSVDFWVTVYRDRVLLWKLGNVISNQSYASQLQLCSDIELYNITEKPKIVICKLLYNVGRWAPSTMWRDKLISSSKPFQLQEGIDTARHDQAYPKVGFRSFWRDVAGETTCAGPRRPMRVTSSTLLWFNWDIACCVISVLLRRLGGCSKTRAQSSATFPRPRTTTLLVCKEGHVKW